MLLTLNQEIEKFNRKSKKHKIRTYKDVILSSSGFPYLDAANGMEYVVYDDEDIPLAVYRNEGYVQGSLINVIGKSGVGKTTLIIKMALHMILPYYMKSLRKAMFNWDSTEDIYTPIVILDSEKNINKSNIRRTTQITKKMMKEIFTISPVTTISDCRRVIEQHILYKVNNMKPVPMAIPDEDGEVLYRLPPSVIISDSNSNLTDIEAVDEKEYEKISSNTAGARMAKELSIFNTWLTDISEKYNITFMNISHINTKPDMGGYGGSPKQYKGLKPGETVKGGERQLYLATNILRLDHAKLVADMNSTTKINLGKNAGGSIIRATHIKTRTNSFGGSATLVMLDDVGHDPLVSTIVDAIEREHIRRVGNSYVLERYPDRKFNRTTTGRDGIRETFKDPAMVEALYEQLRPQWDKSLSKESQLSAINRVNDQMEKLASKSKNDDSFDEEFSLMINS